MMMKRYENHFQQDMQANMKKVCNLAPKTSPKPLQNRSKNLSKSDPKIIQKSIPKPFIFRHPKNRVLRVYIYIAFWSNLV